MIWINFLHSGVFTTITFASGNGKKERQQHK